jgi:hypothetical protein
MSLLRSVGPFRYDSVQGVCRPRAQDETRRLHQSNEIVMHPAPCTLNPGPLLVTNKVGGRNMQVAWRFPSWSSQGVFSMHPGDLRSSPYLPDARMHPLAPSFCTLDCAPCMHPGCIGGALRVQMHPLQKHHLR